MASEETRPRNARSTEVLDEVLRSSSERVKVAIADVDGILRGKYLAKEKFRSAVEGGFGFCDVVFGWDSSDVCYDNAQVTGWHTGYPDALARVDLSTYRRVPWDGEVPFFLCDFEAPGGRAHPACPRRLLKGVLERVEKAGFRAQVGMEFEWFCYRETPQSLAAKGGVNPEPLTPGMFGYSILRASLNQPFFQDLMEKTRAFGIPLEGLHTETGPGVLEAAIHYADALEAADRAVLFKTAAKEIGYRHGILPSFMAKWSASLPGCSGHLHQSVLDSTGRNLFFDAKDPARMSPQFRSYLAGILEALPEILPFFAPTVNSYKRLVDGYWAPTKATWGVDNRTVACRVIPGSEKSTRLEFRVPGSDVNPYLAVSASIAAGLRGLEKGLALKDAPIQGSAYQSQAERLPRNLHEATLRLRDSRLAREILGEAFVDHFVRTREWEWRQFQDSVTDWELKRYFELV